MTWIEGHTVAGELAGGLKIWWAKVRWWARSTCGHAVYDTVAGELGTGGHAVYGVPWLVGSKHWWTCCVGGGGQGTVCSWWACCAAGGHVL